MKSIGEKISAADQKHLSNKRHALEKVHGDLPDLQTGDIVLVRHSTGGPMRYFLRRITNSYWDHSALVIFGKDPEKGYATNLIIEAIQHGIGKAYTSGVEIHRLEKYLDDPKRYDIGIKRFPFLDDDLRRRVRAFVLMNIDTPYYKLYTFKFLLAWLSPMFRKMMLNRQRFSCSGFIQKAFYEAVDWEERSKVIFRNIGYTPIQLQEITTPADIAKSDACKWIWNEH